MPNNRIINGLMDWLSEDGKPNKISIDNKALFESLAEDAASERKNWYTSKRLRFLLVVSTAVVVFISIVYYASAFINDVILYKTEMHVNEQGALNPQKALNCEYALYLFNASEPWANTGVRINEGDKFRLIISGGTNTDITDILESARDNTKPKFGWVFYDKPEPFKNENLLDLCLSKGDNIDEKKVNFGDMLYTIQPEGANVVYSPQAVTTGDIHKWEPYEVDKHIYEANGFTLAKESGVLYLAVNDMVFSERDSLDLDNQFKRYNQVAKSEGQIESLSSSTISLLKDYNSLYYRDNIGQILVAVEIVRNIPKCSFNFVINYPLYAYRDFIYNTREQGWFWPLICFLFKIFVFFAAGVVVVCGIVMLLYYLGHLTNKFLLSKLFHLCT